LKAKIAMTVHEQSMERALIALDGLSIGDSFGGEFFVSPFDFEYAVEMLVTKSLPEGTWKYSDDTLMALSIVASLNKFEKIDQQWLARSFTKRFDIYRGYGRGMIDLLCSIEFDEDWRKGAKNLFKGNGSYGNGAAMRTSPTT
jgi:ADP-ribosylglycohydrolase